MVIANTKLHGILFIVGMHNAVVYAVTAYSFVMNNLTFKNQMCRPPSCPSTSPSLISQGDLIRLVSPGSLLFPPTRPSNLWIPSQRQEA